MTLRRLTAILLLASCAAPAAAQMMTTQRYQKEDTSFISLIAFPNAGVAAVGDHLGVLAIGLAEGTPDVTLYALGPDGAPPAPPPEATPPVAPPLATLNLPRPESLPADRDNQPMFMLFHPKLPILYIWQDADRPKNDSAEYTPVYHELKHLLVYKLDGANVTLAQGFDFGDKVQSGRTLGEMALDADCKRLYVGNLLDRRRNRRTGDEVPVEGVGYLDIGADGLVVLAADNQPSLHATYSTTLPSGPVCGGFAPISDDVVVVSGGYGPITWNLADVHERFHTFFSWPPRYQKRIAAHPTLPIIYVCTYEQGYVYTHHHVDGYITLMPQIASASGPFTAPIVMTGRGGVAFGGAGLLTVYDIDEKGLFTGQWYQVGVNKKQATAAAYSTRFNRLYIAEDPR